MRHTKSELSSGFLTALLAAFFFLTPCGETYAQSGSRAFQMSLWSIPGDPPITSADTDIQSFYQGQPQPAGRSIMLLFNYASSTPLTNLGYDWSRIVAVQVDEPYMYSLDNKANPCGTSRMATVDNVEGLLAAKAAELKSISPLTRFWVNFTHYEIDWMMDTSCPLQIDKPYIDVISLDFYYVSFESSVKPYYDWLVAHPAAPHQQLALIPGTFFPNGGRFPLVQAIAQASLLQGYFDYANNANQHCDLSLGSRGLTGNFDGCRVWIVMGWLAGNYSDGTDYVGELDPRSFPISDIWRQQVAVPLRPELTSQLTGAQILQIILPILLHD